jgi:hypothetical protein
MRPIRLNERVCEWSTEGKCYRLEDFFKKYCYGVELAKLYFRNKDLEMCRIDGGMERVQDSHI